jgi:peptide/nickel transport system ATP-binding protein
VPLEVIKGSVPDPYARVPGCPFHPRCPEFMAGRCDTKVPVEISMDDDPTHTVRCHLYYDDDQVPATTASEA